MAQVKSLLSGTTALLLWGTAFGASPVTVNIERQGMAGALSEFAKQSGMQLLYPSDGQVERLTAKEVVGTYPAEMALNQLLADSGLKYQFVNARTVAIGTSDASLESAGRPLRANSTAEAAEGDREEAPQEPVEEESAIIDGNRNLKRGIPEILVRGSRSLNADIERTPDDIQPYVVFSREEIQRSGTSNVEQLLRTKLTMNYVATPSDEQALAGLGAESLFALRGLDTRNTLILIDGRRPGSRVMGGTILQPDLNHIPMSAIERIEVLPASGSGIHGGSATGGVINVVLRRDYSGLETGFTYESTTEGGGTARTVEMSGAFDLSERTNVSVRGAFSEQDGLLVKDRDFVAEYIHRARENTGSVLVPLGYTTNIQSAFVNGVQPDLTLRQEYGGHSLGSPIAFIPPGYAGVSSDNGLGLLQGAGKFNTDLSETAQQGGGQASLVASSRVKSMSVTIRHRLSEDWEGFLELAGSSSHTAFRVNPFSGQFSIPAGAPGNPFEQDVLITTPVTMSDDRYNTQSNAYRALGGVIFELGRDWRTEVDISFDRNDSKQTFPSSMFSDDVSALVQEGSINVFRDTNAFPVGFSSHIAPVSSISPAHSIQKGVTVRTSGPILELPGGRPMLSMILERFENDYADTEQVRYQSDGSLARRLYEGRSSSVSSAYMELRVPVVAERNGIRGMRYLELQLAGRYDRYYLNAGSLGDGTGEVSPHAGIDKDSFEPTIGMRFSPLAGLTFRASYATGLVPPDLFHFLPTLPVVFPGFFFTDPKRGNEPLGTVTLHLGGRGDLEPERSISRSAGVVVTPPRLPDLRISLDWTKIEKRDNLMSLSFTQDAINNEDVLPGFVVRGPRIPGDPFDVGPITEFDGRYINGARAESESYDFSVAYDYATQSFGTWSFYGAATRMVHNLDQVVSFFPAREKVGTLASPRWRVNGTLAWRRGSMDISWTTRYLDSFWLREDHQPVVAQGGARVGAASYHDIAVTFRLDSDSGLGLLSNVDLRAGVKNVFNKKPRFYALSSTGRDPWGDPRMATYYVTLFKRFGAAERN